ncbi:unnamed protein product [Trifolium pratense]|uniref:Uncharacterized protein n=1 Tax=Trifolium pratense TaxID=57577 RepID=A0ACB0M7Q2_TRIPR|nr:unnamed protein product [Trifolium pratense]
MSVGPKYAFLSHFIVSFQLFHFPAPLSEVTARSLSHGESSTLYQQSPQNRIRCNKAPRATAITFIRTRFCD